MLRKAAEAAAEAYCPYSRYRVGAALMTTGGELFLGSNVENASYGLSLCAERVALVKAVSAGCRDFRAMAVVADGSVVPYPCGACRQALSEFCSPRFLIYVATSKSPGGYRRFTLGSLLPKSFELL